MPKKSTLEIEALAEALQTRFRASASSENDSLVFGAGTTRLGKIEFINRSKQRAPMSLIDPLHDIEECLLIRIRHKFYSSAGTIESGIFNTEPEVRIHLEHQSGIAQSIQIPFRSKRPRLVTLGNPTQSPTQPRWFHPALYQ